MTGKKTTTKLAKDLAAGDVVIDENGKPRKIKSITKGLWRGSRILTYSDGEYTNLSDSEEVEVKER